MKNIVLFVVACFTTLSIMAQENEQEIALTKEGAVIEYSLYAKIGFGKPKLAGYYRMSVLNINESDGNREVIYHYDAMDNKKNPIKGSSVDNKIDITETQMIFYRDPLLNTGNYMTSHDGFAFKIPLVLNVGDAIEGGTVTETAKFPMSPSITNNLKYSDLKVVAFEDVSTNAGIFQCYRIDGVVNGTMQNERQKDTPYSIWFSPVIGIVKVSTGYYNEEMTVDAVAGF